MVVFLNLPTTVDTCRESSAIRHRCNKMGISSVPCLLSARDETESAGADVAIETRVLSNSIPLSTKPLIFRKWITKSQIDLVLLYYFNNTEYSAAKA